MNYGDVSRKKRKNSRFAILFVRLSFMLLLKVFYLVTDGLELS
jgi:hypothetical protein